MTKATAGEANEDRQSRMDRSGDRADRSGDGTDRSGDGTDSAPAIADADVAFPALNLPAYQPGIRSVDGKHHIFDPIRRQFVRLTPEEWVRQHFLDYLTRCCGYPAALTAVERGFRFQGMARRADILVHDRRGRPFLMVECKAPGVPISQSTFDQVSRYNRVVDARFLVVTNGLKHYCWTIEETSYRFLDGPPPYEAHEDSP